MSLQLLKISLPVITIPLAELFNIRASVFPSAWKTGQIISVHKKGNCAENANYRPITLLPLLSKAVEYGVHQQLKVYLECHHILHLAQQFPQQKIMLLSSAGAVKQAVNSEERWPVFDSCCTRLHPCDRQHQSLHSSLQTCPFSRHSY